MGCGAGASVAQINLAACRRVGDEISGGGAEGHEAAVSACGWSIAVGVAWCAVTGGREQSGLGLATGRGAGASITHENLCVAVLRGGIGDVAAIESKSGRFFREGDGGSSCGRRVHAQWHCSSQ